MTSPGGGADQGGELGADPLAGREPPLTPSADEPPTPLALDRVAEPRGGPPGQPPEGIAVEVDEARVADDELAPEARERVGRVQTAGLHKSVRVDRLRPTALAGRRPGAGAPTGAPCRATPTRPVARRAGRQASRPATGPVLRDRPAPAWATPLRSRHRSPAPPRASALKSSAPGVLPHVRRVGGLGDREERRAPREEVQRHLARASARASARCRPPPRACNPRAPAACSPPPPRGSARSAAGLPPRWPGHAGGRDTWLQAMGSLPRAA